MTEPYHQDATVTVWAGDCLDVLPGLPDNSVDAVCTDPPYGLEFMGREWDGADGFRRSLNKADVGRESVFGRTSRVGPEYRAGLLFQEWCQAWATECLRILKPGGHLLAFGGTRTWHRLTCAVEDAGFETRDSIAWLYGSGFPKSRDVSKAIDAEAGAVRNGGAQRLAPVLGQEAKVIYRKGKGNRLCEACGKWTFATDHCTCSTDGGPATPEAAQWQGWGTALKPAFEPVVVARKPLVGTVAANVLRFGTGALNIDATRIETDWDTDPTRRGWQGRKAPDRGMFSDGANIRADHSQPNAGGRWPANVCLDESQAAALDQMSGELTSQGGRVSDSGMFGMKAQPDIDTGYGDSGGASRFFYTAREDEPCPTSSSSPDTTDSELCTSTLEPGSPGPPKAQPTTGEGAKGEPEAAASGATSESVTAPKPTIDPELSSRFFYTAKAGSEERITHNGVAHPTVKPLSLMRWLVRLVCPPGGLILDPFAGSGTTVEAAILEGFRCIAVERGGPPGTDEHEYLPMILQRINRRRDPIAYITAAGEDLGLFADM